MARRVNVVPHTHWDREWYLPFQTYRLRLVEVLDDLLPRMEADPSYRRFLLDGQLAAVDDYVAVRPEAAETIRRLVANGRLSIGPWYTLPDELLISGESLIRNLQLGLRTAARYGGGMEVGYLPDMFGHVAQMPQVLRQLGFDAAVVWRGVPSAVDRSGFWWRAPDGSTVRAEYLPQGYGNGALLPDDAKALVAQVAEFHDLWRDLLADSPILWMNGGDHQAPRPWLGRVVAEANDIQGDYELVVTSLPEHLATVPVGPDLPTWDGELRSGARANLLMGVTSNRVDVRVAAATAERALERCAEPLAALHLPAERWPAALLDEAWRHVIRNEAHDSVCACSVDEVCDAVLHRYAEARQIADGLARQAAEHLARRVGAGDGGAAGAGAGVPLVVNPSGRDRGGLVELTLPGDEAPAGTQAVRRRPAESVALEGPAALVVPATEELNWDVTVTSFRLEAAATGAPLVEADRSKGELITSGTKAELAAVAATSAGGEVRLVVRRDPVVRVLARVDGVPGFGWTTVTDATIATAAAPVEVTGDGSGSGAVLANGLVRVEVDGATGLFSLDGHGGLGRLVEGGDCGDTYNWCPPTSDTLVDGPESVAVRVVEEGPVRGRVEVDRAYLWPERCEGLDRRVGAVAHTVTTTLELRAGEPFVRVEVSVDNRSRDHRLRLHLPLPEPATASRAECSFAVVERGLAAEGGPTERALPTHPARRFVQAGGLTVVHDGVAEYELVDVDGTDGTAAAHTLALTVLRCTGMLSQGPMATRPLPAGPLIRMEGPQLQQRVTMRYAVARTSAAAGDVDPFTMADDVLVPLVVAGAARGDDRVPGEGLAAAAAAEAPLPATGRALAVEGAQVSAVYREGRGLRVRVFNPTAEAVTVSVPDRRGWVVDLRDAPLAPFAGQVPLGPWAFATLALTD
jgi:2-O-(6-phospho-alpha-D-mannosyl)-D-glycerate hydrolase